MKRICVLFASIMACTVPACTFATAPDTPVLTASQPLRSSGTIDVDLAMGMLRGKVCLANRPERYRSAFSLNAGLNVARVTDGEGRAIGFDGWYEPGIDGEARVYALNASASVICVDFVGAFPVYPRHDAPLDFKGVIAFNGDSVRATEQSAWLPLPYDPEAKARLDNTAYDLRVSCAACSFIYVNGSDPITGQDGKFISDRRRPAMLFAGKGAISQSPGLTILNETLPAAESAALVAGYTRIEAFYGRYLGKQIEDRPSVMRVIAINQAERDRKGSEWGFATWPTVAFSGSILPIATALMNGGELGERRLGYLAHEIGHYYFGTLTDPGGRYHWFLVESTAEFLSLKARGALVSPAAEQRRADVLAGELTDQKQSFKALDEVTDSDQIDDLYRYDYGPLLLLSLEKQVGEKKMARFMRALLASGRIDTWQDMATTAARAGIGQTEWEAWRRRCVKNGTRACVGPERNGAASR